MSSCDCSLCQEIRDFDRKLEREYRAKYDKTFSNIFNAVKIWLALQKAFEMGYLKGKVEGRNSLRQWQNRE